MDKFLNALSTIAQILDKKISCEGFSEGFLDEIIHCIEKIKQENDLLNVALDNCVDSFHITDRNGKVLRVNHAYEIKTKLSRDFVEGNTVEELSKTGLYKPCMTHTALQEKRKITYIQDGPGGKAITTLSPITDSEGEVKYIVGNARFVEELKLLYKFFSDNEHNYYAYDDIPLEFVCKSPEMSSLWTMISLISKVDSSILITGETGSGKSFIAKHIHNCSSRKNEKFIEINCAAIPESLMEAELFGYSGGAFTGANKNGKKGLIEMADKGTLFLDEIGDMPLNLQAKFFQVLQNREITPVGGTDSIPIDIRLITATNWDLENMIKNGRFRKELYYRINVVPLNIPPLRERREDIEALIKLFLERFNSKYHSDVSISKEAAEHMKNYLWPGNIRELQNLVERLVVTNCHGIIGSEDLPNSILSMTYDTQKDISVNRIIPLKTAMEEVERQLITAAFNEYHNSYKVAEILQISQSGASRKYLKYIGEPDSADNENKLI